MKRCAHQLCQCTDASYEAGGRKFCSDLCADVVDHAENQACPCGHAACAASEGKL